MKHGTHQILVGDVLDHLAEMPDDSIDCILSDPPYGIDFQSRYRPADRRLAKIAGDKEPHVAWITEAHRVAKIGTAMACFHRWDVAEAFRVAIEDAGWSVRAQCVWYKGSGGMGDLKGTPALEHEPFWFATKGRFEFPAGRMMSVIRATQLPPPHRMHPNEKSIGLYQHLVRHLTVTGDVVLDPFAGSGSCLAAAASLGRDAIGIEINPQYAAMAEQRVARTLRPSTHRSIHSAPSPLFEGSRS